MADQGKDRSVTARENSEDWENIRYLLASAMCGFASLHQARHNIPEALRVIDAITQADQPLKGLHGSSCKGTPEEMARAVSHIFIAARNA